jgi:galactose mutarotase-like enzyme
MNYTISNSILSIAINSKGAELQSLKNIQTNKEYIWEGNPEFWGKHSPVLFPIVGALKNDSYIVDDVKYNLSRHGFARDYEFSLFNKTENSITFLLQYSNETLNQYPFKFNFAITYQLVENKLFIYYNVKNVSPSKMPFSIGAHPAFSLPNPFKNYSLEFELDEELKTSKLKDNLFSGETKSIALQNKKLPLSYSIFKDDALVFKKIKSKSVSILENDLPILKINYTDFSSLGIWTVQNAPFICIEPWIGYADNHDASGNLFEKEGIQILQPEESFKAQFSLEIL